MTNFDGMFALNYILPLAEAAYSEPWNAARDPILDSFTQVQEIFVDESSTIALLVDAGEGGGDTSLLRAMLRPAGTGSPPSPADAVHAETGIPAELLTPSMILDVEEITPTTPVDKRFGWVCRDGKRLIVAFRGTQTTGDWLRDLDFVSAPYRPIAGSGTVHRGFQTVYYAIRENLLDLVKNNSDGVTELLVTGHSLGAALAVLAMPDLLNFLNATLGIQVSPISYTLAGPREGHRDFQRLFNSLVKTCWRVVNLWDIVPGVPPTLAGYIHVGSQLTVETEFSFDIARNHEIETGYLPGLTKWVAEHPGKGSQALGMPKPPDLAGVSN